MTKQYLLFPLPSCEAEQSCQDEPRSHRHDPQTSRAAAERFKRSGKLQVHRQIVLDGVRRCNGGTHSEIAAGTPLDWLQVARRLSELERAGFVRKGPARRCRVKGSKCSTWWFVEDAG
jgi:hypothetical protein